jgi:hypothetical protein
MGYQVLEVMPSTLVDVEKNLLEGMTLARTKGFKLDHTRIGESVSVMIGLKKHEDMIVKLFESASYNLAFAYRIVRRHV